jgi:hypothetical protein
MTKKILEKAKWLYEAWECPIENCQIVKCRKDRCIKKISQYLALAKKEKA